MVSVNSAASVANNAAQQSCGLSNFCSSACDKVSCFARAVISTFAELPALCRSAFSGTVAWTVANPLAAAVVVITVFAIAAFFTYRYFRADAPAANNQVVSTQAPAESTQDTPVEGTPDTPVVGNPALLSGTPNPVTA